LQDNGLAHTEVLAALSIPSAAMRSLAALLLWHWFKGEGAAGATTPQVGRAAVQLFHNWAWWPGKDKPGSAQAGSGGLEK